MRRMTYFVMALALVLGFTQCKKEQLDTPQNEGNSVMITLDVDGGASTGSATEGSRANVNPPRVNFVQGDRILVAYDGKYVGHIDHNGTCFTGTINATGNSTKPLYFYFLGNKADVTGLTEGSSTTCTVNISDQSDYPHLPVISMAPSDQTFPSEGNHYSAKLLNKCSLMQFNVNSNSTAAICITGMNNKVTVNFDPTTGDTDEGFTYSQDTDGGFMKLSGKDSEGHAYAIVLPQAELTSTGEAYTIDGYVGTRPTLPALGTDEFYTSYTINMSTQSAWDGDLSKLTSSSTEAYATARNGMTIYGTYNSNNNVKVSIADGATVTLRNVNIEMQQWSWPQYAGLSCLGDATIILEDGTQNTVKGSSGLPGIHVVEGKNLTIQGNTGKLFAYGCGNSAGIGGGANLSNGNIIINGGEITAIGEGGGAGIGSGMGSVMGGTITINDGIVRATGGNYAAGIGSSNQGADCGTITVSGGTVTAEGGFKGVGIGSGPSGYCSGGINIIGGTVIATGNYAAGIGSGAEGDCGTITVSGGTVTATGGYYGTGIGSGTEGNCSGGITIIGGTVNAIGGNYAAGIGSSNEESDCGTITIRGGTVTAAGGTQGAGIGSATQGNCSGGIDIIGGTVNATGGYFGAGIGSGAGGNCSGGITIANTVTSVTATKGEYAPNSIGAGRDGTCGTVKIGGTVYYQNNAYVGTGSTYLTQNQIVYPQP